MSNPILRVTLETHAGRSWTVEAVFDTGSFYALARKDALPRGTRIELRLARELWPRIDQGCKGCHFVHRKEGRGPLARCSPLTATRLGGQGRANAVPEVARGRGLFPSPSKERP